MRKYLPLGMELEDDKVSGGSGIVLLREIWAEVGKLRREEISTLITEPSVALFDAINSENDNQVINTFLERIGIFTTVKDPKGRNPLHLLFLHRRYEIFKWHENKWKEQLRAVDSGGNNVLHLAAHLPPQLQSFSGLTASNQMLIEVKWFKVNSFIFLYSYSLILYQYCIVRHQFHKSSHTFCS